MGSKLQARVKRGKKEMEGMKDAQNNKNTEGTLSIYIKEPVYMTPCKPLITIHNILHH